jgi:hypothetical protein
MFCNNDYCAEYLPCMKHQDIFEYEVESCHTIQSGFTSLTFECEKSKHKNDGWFGRCSHFRSFQFSQDGFVFKSSTLQLSEESGYWYEDMECNICFKPIDDPDELVLNLTDMCQFHYKCIQRMLKTHKIRTYSKMTQAPSDLDHICPSCDTDRCRACYHCSY